MNESSQDDDSNTSESMSNITFLDIHYDTVSSVGDRTIFNRSLFHFHFLRIFESLI